MNQAPKPVPIKNRVSFVFLEKGRVDVIDGAFVLVDKNGIRTQIPIGKVACLMLEPGIRVSHAASVLAARTGTLMIWVGEGGVRLYSAGQPGGARSDRLLWQAACVLDPKARLKVVRKMFELRFGKAAPSRRSVKQLQGIEGARVRKLYKRLAQQYGVEWKGRNYDPKKWEQGDVVNRCLSAATSCLYGVTEAAILAAGYAPAIGFIHTGKPRSFVFDIADIFKFDTVVPLAFQIAKKRPASPSAAVRHACRDKFREERTLRKLVPTIQEVLEASELPMPKPGAEQVAPAIPSDKRTGDAGHRS
jgi:CRISPR-associated protein Cas1